MKIYKKNILIVFTFICLVDCTTSKKISTSGNSKENKKNTPTKSISFNKKYSEILGVSESKITDNSLYQFINEWYGVPYKYAGKDKTGIDCSGLASKLYYTVFNKKISSSTKVLIDEVKKIKESDLREGDLVFFYIESSKPTHVGVYLQNHKFVHASTKKGVMISDLNEPYFKKYFCCSGRVK